LNIECFSKPSQWGKYKFDWPTVSSKEDGQMNWMTIDDDIPSVVPEDDAMARRMQFWDQILQDMRSDPKLQV